jgi:hypothetical protein
MWNALFAFENSADAEDVSRRLRDAGFPGDGIRLHRRASGSPDGTVDRVDEQVSGGVLSNLYNLFQGVLEWGGSPHDAAPYEAVVLRGGAVLEVWAADDEARRAAEVALQSGVERHTAWREVR